LEAEEKKIGLRLFLLDNSGSTDQMDGHYLEELPNGAVASHACSRWEEIKHMALEQAKWNDVVGTPCEFILLNPVGGPLKEGRDFLRTDHCGPGTLVNRLHKMLRPVRP